MDDASGAPELPRDARETAQYIEAMARDLKRMAVAADLGFLAYLLSMVEDDAGAMARKLATGESV